MTIREPLRQGVDGELFRAEWRGSRVAVKVGLHASRCTHHLMRLPGSLSLLGLQRIIGLAVCHLVAGVAVKVEVHIYEHGLAQALVRQCLPWDAMGAWPGSQLRLSSAACLPS